MSARRGAGVAGATVAVVLTLVAAGCGSTSDAASNTSISAVSGAPTSTTATSGPSTTTTTLPNPCRADDPTRSYPPSALPPAGQLPSGAWADRIRSNGVLRVGVDENTLFFSSKDPLTGEISGFEDALAHAIAAAILGDREKVKFVTVTTSEKINVVHDDVVDLSIDVNTIGCGRWGFVDFSTAYYRAFLQMMVRGDSPITGQADLPGKRVCVTSPSSSEDFVTQNIPTAKLVRVITRTECLTRLQENKVDAIVLPSSIMAGLAVQDPNNKVFPDALVDTKGNRSTNTYGIAVNKNNQDLTRFVNALLEQWRHDGTLTKLQDENLPIYLREPTPTPAYLG